MGTRSITIVRDGTGELCRIYRHHNGWPETHGVELARLCNVRLVNGLPPNPAGLANGMDCLAAQIVAGLKTGPGDVYLMHPGAPIDSLVDYVYTVYSVDDSIMILAERREHLYGATAITPIFSGTPEQMLSKYATP